MICALLRWNAFYFYALVYGSALLIRIIVQRFTPLSFTLFANIVPENLTITRSYTFNSASRRETLSNMLLWTFVNSVCLTMLAILGNHNQQIGIQIPTFYPFVQTNHYWAKIPLVQNISTFNSLFILSMAAGNFLLSTSLSA